MRKNNFFFKSFTLSFIMNAFLPSSFSLLPVSPSLFFFFSTFKSCFSLFFFFYIQNLLYVFDFFFYSLPRGKIIVLIFKDQFLKSLRVTRCNREAARKKERKKKFGKEGEKKSEKGKVSSRNFNN